MIFRIPASWQFRRFLSVCLFFAEIPFPNDSSRLLFSIIIVFHGISNHFLKDMAIAWSLDQELDQIHILIISQRIFGILFGIIHLDHHACIVLAILLLPYHSSLSKLLKSP